MTSLSLSKPCNNCKVPKPFSEFYVRSGIDNPTEPGHYLTECKDCMKGRNKKRAPLSPLVPHTPSEVLAMDYLRSHGVVTYPGKALRFAHVDVVAWGCVGIEVKYARLEQRGPADEFQFVTTKAQQRDGFRGHAVMLICDDGTGTLTHHLFDVRDPVFYIKGRVKTGFTFRPDRTTALKHGNNRVVMLQSMMDAALDNLALIEAKRLEISAQMKAEYTPHKNAIA